jgi:hypothetical protein
MKIKILAVMILIFVFFLVVDLIRREKLTFKYAVVWIFMCLVGITGAVYENLIFKSASFLGFELPSNFIFFLFGVFLVVLSLMLSIYICQQNRHLELIAQKIALMELELSKLKKELSELKNLKE